MNTAAAIILGLLGFLVIGLGSGIVPRPLPRVPRGLT